MEKLRTPAKVSQRMAGQKAVAFGMVFFGWFCDYEVVFLQFYLPFCCSY
jgi:hypothetical protein